jgi:hypothetical protein
MYWSTTHIGVDHTGIGADEPLAIAQPVIESFIANEPAGFDGSR